MDTKRRHELAVFLRTRRAALSPVEVGLHGGTRRRTPGLRREEVAQLSGISVTWYTWLEQQRDVSISPQVAGSLARALRLNDAERRHLYALTGHRPPAASVPPAGPGVDPVLRDLVDALLPHPAYVMNRCWDLLAYNSAYDVLMGGLDRLAPAERNGLRILFVEPAMRTLVTGWEDEARRLLGQFRATNGDRTDDPRVEALVTGLQRDSPDFARLWAEHGVESFTSARKSFRHPDLGALSLNYVKLTALDDPDQHLVAFMPADATTARRFGELAGAGVQPTGAAPAR